MSEQDVISPRAWLWQELERRLGKEEADDLHREYNARQRQYERALGAERTQRRAENAARFAKNRYTHE